ncbi:hypothetical protein Strvi_7610 [Streptomyces violaceusniger Tu 4113]|uniref:Uncharacterized protein n=1 Tax=Streptomyces violaceusniger (strain Tu 4113) TaxID=653045 RepID=G2P763_STRV4|nr:hypothetical protein Strvi_7610 [Streptomyces violaceusniger Tu 4113]
MTGFGKHLAQRVPEAERPIADGLDRGAHTAPLAVPQQIGPGCGRFAVAIGHRDQFLGAVRPYAHEHQDRGLGLVEADPQVDAVRPDIDVVGGGQVALTERGVVGLPLHGEPGDRGRGEPGRRAEELLQSGHEVAGRQAVQVLALLTTLLGGALFYLVHTHPRLAPPPSPSPLQVWLCWRPARSASSPGECGRPPPRGPQRVRAPPARRTVAVAVRALAPPRASRVSPIAASALGVGGGRTDQPWW